MHDKLSVRLYHYISYARVYLALEFDALAVCRPSEIRSVYERLTLFSCLVTMLY